MKADLDPAPAVDPVAEPVDPADVAPVTKEAREASYLAALAVEDRAQATSEAARLDAQKAVEATLLPGDRLESYDEAWARLALPGLPSVPNVVANGVVLQRVPAKGGK